MEKQVKPDFEEMGESKKVRLTLWVDPLVKETLKRQASEAGVTASAYVSVIVMTRDAVSA